jgi:hypothetical protein
MLNYEDASLLAPAPVRPLLMINTDFLSSVVSPLSAEPNSAGILYPYITSASTPGLFGDTYSSPVSPVSPLFALTDVASHEPSFAYPLRPLDRTKRTPTSPTKHHICLIADCNKSFSTKYRLKSHSVSHSNQRPYIWYGFEVF